VSPNSYCQVVSEKTTAAAYPLQVVGSAWLLPYTQPTVPAASAPLLASISYYPSALITQRRPSLHYISAVRSLMASGLELCDTRGRQWEFVDNDDDATVSDAEGAGRTIGKLISWGGRRLDAVIVRLSRRLGAGPSGPMLKIIHLVHKSRRRCPGPKSRRVDWVVAPHAASSEDILQTLLQFDTICDICLEKHQAFLSNKRMVAYAKSLIKMLQ
jgi:hypothetical protein